MPAGTAPPVRTRPDHGRASPTVRSHRAWRAASCRLVAPDTRPASAHHGFCLAPRPPHRVTDPLPGASFGSGAHCDPVECLCQFGALPGSAVPFVLHDGECALRETPVEPPGRHRRAADVSSAVHEGGGDVLNAVEPSQDRVVSGHEGVVAPVVRYQSGELLTANRADVSFVPKLRMVQGDVHVLPPVPSSSCRFASRGIRRREETGIRVDDPLAGTSLAGAFELVPFGREQSTDALRDPIDLAPASRCDGHECECTNTLRVLLCVRQRERGSPGDSGDDPGVNPESSADDFNVIDELLSVLSIHPAGQTACRAAPAGAALVDSDESVSCRVEVSAVPAASE